MSAPGDLIAGRYRLVRLIGSGGMGAVWESLDERLGRPVALKLLHRQFGLAPGEAELANQRAMREARITARVHHRNAVPIFDVVEHEGRPCLVMPYLPSVPLSNQLRESGPREAAEAVRIGAQISAALATAHAAGVVHRDVKPGNVLICHDGLAMISDFGISHAYGDATLTATGLVHGTPAFLSPEVARGAKTTYASDVFSLGSTLYATVEGRPPFGTDPNPIVVLHRVAAGEFEPPTRGGPLTDIVTAMLSSDPDGRPTMVEAADAIAALTRVGHPVTPAATLPLPTLEAPVPEPTPEPEPAAASDPKPIASAEPAEPVAPVAPVPSGRAQRPAPTPVEWPTLTPEPVRPPRPKRGGSRRPLLIGLLVVVLIAVLATAVVLNNRASTGLAGDGTTPSTRRSASSSPSAEPSASPTPSASPSSSVGSTPTAAQLAAVIDDYYAVMPKGTDQGWEMLTASYQRSPSGGRAAYEKFWAGIERVRADDVVARPPNQVEAEIRYRYSNGQDARERTLFGIVDDDGVLKINSSRVIGG